MSNGVFVSRDGEGMKRSGRLHLCRVWDLLEPDKRAPPGSWKGSRLCRAVAGVGVELCVRGLEGQEGGGGLAVQKRDKNKDSCPSATF